MTSTDDTTIARRVLEEIFPTNDDAALREVISDEFVNHEAPAGTPPGLGSVTMFMHLLNEAFSDQRWANSPRSRQRQHLAGYGVSR